jgi:MFS superfamily sulfate permease-like transporter
MNRSKWWRGAPTWSSIVAIVVAAILAVKVNFFIGIAVGLALVAIFIIVRKTTEQIRR